MESGRYASACAAIDHANDEDPGGRERLYSQRMASWVQKLAPAASEELLLAARAQHIRRWTSPRSSYPAGRAGYLQWRENLKRFHADLLEGIMKEAGYGPEPVAKARSLLIRKNLAQDPEGQTLEDAACLVFLEFELSEFAGKSPAEKTVEILRKSWQKMSALGRARALELKLEEPARELVRQALG